MYLILSLLSLIIGWLIGLLTDCAKVDNNAIHWLIGLITGIICGVLITLDVMTKLC